MPEAAGEADADADEVAVTTPTVDDAEGVLALLSLGAEVAVAEDVHESLAPVRVAAGGEALAERVTAPTLAVVVPLTVGAARVGEELTERVREGVAEPVAEAVTHTVGLMDALPDAEGQ